MVNKDRWKHYKKDPHPKQIQFNATFSNNYLLNKEILKTFDTGIVGLNWTLIMC